MPAIASGKVLVSGASGYIAAWVVKKLLENGYSVKGTVRSTSKGEYLKKKFQEYDGKFEYVIVEDIAKDGAFDDAVKGVDAVVHTASPFHLNADDPEELIGPAVKGTVGMLKSVLKNGTSVQRVVITSSCAAVVNPAIPPPVFLTEESWNIDSPEQVAKKGKNASSFDKYRASKTLAERGAWQFVENNKGNISWDLVSMNPPFVFGPIIHEVSSPENLNTSVANFYQALKGRKSNEDLAKPGGCWIDVRDVAHAHVRSIQVPAAGGNRFITSTAPYTMQDLLDALSTSGLPDIPLGSLGATKSFVHPVVYNSAAAKKVLGLEFTTLEKSTKDMTVSIRERGW